jgi:hypothetical protein
MEGQSGSSLAAIWMRISSPVNLNHLNLVVSDVDAAEAFFTSYFDFTEVPVFEDAIPVRRRRAARSARVELTLELWRATREAELFIETTYLAEPSLADTDRTTFRRRSRRESLTWRAQATAAIGSYHANAIAAAPAACRLGLRCPDRRVLGVLVVGNHIADPAPFELREHRGQDARNPPTNLAGSGPAGATGRDGYTSQRPGDRPADGCYVLE